MEKKLIYDIHDRPKNHEILIFAIQQLLAIMAATITVPMMVGNGMSVSAALFGAGVGTLNSAALFSLARHLPLSARCRVRLAVR